MSVGDGRRAVRGAAVIPEIRLALTAAATCALLTPVVAGSGFLLGGAPAALGATVGVALVGLLAVASLPLYRWAARRGNDAVAGAAFGGVMLRLTLAACAFAVASRIPALSMTSLALALAVALCATLAAEMRVASRDPRLSWIDTSARTGKAGALDPVSERTTA